MLPAALDPSTLALAVLQETDPLPILEAWSLEPEALVRPRLQALLELLRQGHTSPALQHTGLDLAFGDRGLHLDLLLLPSIFPPEAWGMTFLEGLLRRAQRGMAGQRLVELGTGSGWVSLALLGLTDLDQVLGVDLNPEAVVMSRLNALLNGFGARFQSAVSDLLAEPRHRGFRADYIVGCIPQVIAPNHLQSLYDLSNYFAAQGLVEDQFGLGLNARALRESLLVLRPEGRVILNLAGRPGEAVVRRMFLRRGFEPEVLWRSRVQQASDTDIAPLVELEARTGSPFAFHLHRHSPESVNARVALAAQQAGQPIYHELQVVEGRPRSQSLFALAELLERLELQDLWERVDLSLASDEQIAFVTRLAEGLAADPRVPYAHEAGDAGFRRRVTDFLRKFHGLPLRVDETFAAPSRAELLHALLLCLVEPGSTVALSAELLPAYARALAKHGADPVALHGDPEEIAELLPVLRPRLVVLEGALAAQPASLERVLRACRDLDCLLVLDASEGFVIGSRGPEHPALRFMAAHRDHPHLALLVGFIHSQAFPDVSLGLLLSRHRTLHQALEAAADLTYSRLSTFHQAYYGALFDELLCFRVGASDLELAPLETPGLALRPAFAALLDTPPFSRPAPAEHVIRLDYGENESPIPQRLRLGILEGFLAPPQAQAEDAPVDERARQACADYLRATRLPGLRDREVLLGMGTQPFLFDALKALPRGGPLKVLLPEGSYGLFGPLARAAGCDVRTLPTAAPNFQATPEAVAQAGPFDVLLLTHPGNPSGAAYGPEAIRDLVRLAASQGAKVILDEVFGLLADLGSPLPLGQDRWAGLSEPERKALLVFTGASKEFAAGGLRLGLAASADCAWLQAIAAQRLDPLPRSIQVAARTLFEDLPACFREVEELRCSLADRRSRLRACLESLGLPTSEKGGGLFLFAEIPHAGADEWILRLEERTGVRLNTPSWSGTSRHARACYSLPEEKLAEACRRLQPTAHGPQPS